MPIFEITLRGFNPDDSDTDYLVKWVKAPGTSELLAFLNRYRIGPSIVVETPRLLERPESFDTEDGVDVVLGKLGSVIRMAHDVDPTLWPELAKGELA